MIRLYIDLKQLVKEIKITNMNEDVDYFILKIFCSNSGME